MGPEKGRSRSLTLTQYFLLILSKLFCLFFQTDHLEKMPWLSVVFVPFPCSTPP